MAFKPKDQPVLLWNKAKDTYYLSALEYTDKPELILVNCSVGPLYDMHAPRAALQGFSLKHSMLPRTLAKPGCSEHAEQCALFCCLQIASEYFPQLAAAFAIPNGGSRGDTDLSRKIAGGKMKAEGVKTGVPDVFLALPVGKFAGLFIELKRKDGSIKDLSTDQIQWAANLRSVGYKVECCFGWVHSMEVIKEYLQL